jgi:hypothetical protein
VISANDIVLLLATKQPKAWETCLGSWEQQNKEVEVSHCT